MEEAANGQAINALKHGIPARRHTIACSIRSPMTTIAGWWQDLVKHGSSQALLDCFCDCITSLQHHIMYPTGVLDAWADVFGAGAVRPFIYESCGDLPSHFFRTFLPKVRSVPVPAASGRNRRLSHGTNEVLRGGNIHRKRLVSSLKSPEVKAVVRVLEKASAGSVRKKPLTMDEPGFAWLENRLAKKLGARLGLEAGGEVFPDRSGTLDDIDGDLYPRFPELGSSLTRFCQSFSFGSVP